MRLVKPDQALGLIAEGLRAAGVTGLAVLPDAQGQIRLVGNEKLRCLARLGGQGPCRTPGSMSCAPA